MSHLTRVVKGASCFRGTRARGAVIEALLAAIDLRRLAKERHAVVHARIGTAVEDENTLPGRRDFVGKLGKRRVGKQIEFVAEPFGPVELYHMLGWVRGEPKRAWIAPEVLRW